VLLTHIHLDHAGASGFLARQGATIHVHPNGVKHLVNPEKLLESAKRIYGNKMDFLWGEFLPVPEDKIHVLEDEEEINIGDLILKLIMPRDMLCIMLFTFIMAFALAVMWAAADYLVKSG
jgi:glyoxylase-like metal-dependent hydrolase (beta-lactamase superfamily II)